MSIAVAMGRPLRLVGRGNGKHAMPRGAVRPQPAQDVAHDKQHQPKHAASVPRQRTAA